jgi:hypothetical protein
MKQFHYAGVAAVLVASALAAQAQQQAPAPAPAQAPAPPAAAAPPTATTKVTDNVYIFRYVGHQAIRSACAGRLSPISTPSRP